MTRRAAAWAVAGCIAAAAPAAAQSAPSVIVAGPATNPITDGIATFTISAANFIAADFPLRLELQVSRTPDFGTPLFADTTVNGPTATIVIPHLLPGSGVLYWRAFALTARAGSIPSDVTGPRVAPTHLRLLTPNNPAGQSLSIRRPTFVWQSSVIPAAFGPWQYELHVEETATGNTPVIVSTTDTTAVVATDLEANKSYRWRVIARLPATGDSVNVASFASFVILSSDAPLTTVMFNPFPSPFPSAALARMCVWFDLQVGGPVTLDIIDLRGLPVRRLAPSAGVSATLPSGRYGRPSPDATSGCDDRFAWDGTDARGRVVSAGTYQVRLQAGGKVFFKGVVFLGR